MILTGAVTPNHSSDTSAKGEFLGVLRIVFFFKWMMQQLGKD
jgi:hypothetical protein